MLRMLVDLPSPERLARVPMSTIVDFSRRRAVERQAFRAAVEGILNVATTIDDRYALEDHLSSQRIVLQSAVKDLRMTLDEIRVTSVPARNAHCCPPSPLRRARRERSPVQLRIAELSDDRIGQVRFVRYG